MIKMSMLCRLALFGVACALVACTGGSMTSAPNGMPPPTQAPPPLNQHVYVALERPNSLDAIIQDYTLPLSSASVPNFQLIIPLGGDGGICTDNQGRLFVSAPTGVEVYTPPITSNSTPSFTLPVTHLWTPASGCATDRAGDLYVPEFVSGFPNPTAGFVDVFQAPVKAGSTPIKTLNAGIFTDGICTDTAGDVFVLAGIDPNAFPRILEFSPRASGNSLLATFGANNLGTPAIGLDGNLYALDFGGPPNFIGQIDVFPPSSFHNGGVKDHSIILGSRVFGGAIAFDRAGNMLVITLQLLTQARMILTLPPPYVSTATILQLGPAQFSNNIAGDIAVAP